MWEGGVVWASRYGPCATATHLLYVQVMHFPKAKLTAHDRFSCKTPARNRMLLLPARHVPPPAFCCSRHPRPLPPALLDSVTRRNANLHNGQATQIEFNIGADIGVGPLLDFYDISQVNAYNEPVQLRPINAPASAG